MSDLKHFAESADAYSITERMTPDSKALYCWLIDLLGPVTESESSKMDPFNLGIFNFTFILFKFQRS